MDYVDPPARVNRLAEIAAEAPVIVLRTFSKIFGLAGLRLGYAVVHESLAPHVNAVHEPFNVNRAGSVSRMKRHCSIRSLRSARRSASTMPEVQGLSANTANGHG